MPTVRSRQTLSRLLGLLGLLAAAAAARAAEEGPDPHRTVREGVAVEFSLLPVDGGAGSVREGDYAEIRFRLTEEATGRPAATGKPAAWLDMAGVVGGRKGEERECREKIGLYLKGVVGIRPMVDLNAYYLLVLNADASISVIDPVVSMTGTTSLFATVVLKRPAADWAKAADDKRLYVTMPKAGELAVVDTEAFKVLASIPVGGAPMRVAVHPGGREIWVGDDAAGPAGGGVAVVDAGSLKLLGTVATGRGHHELAFSADGRLAFVANREDGTVTAVDVATRRKLKDVRTGPVPIALATSPLSRATYVADGRTGAIAAIDPASLEVVARIPAKPGLGPMRISPDGRWAFAVNPAERAVFVVDTASNTLAHEIPLGGQPYQVMFTRAFAYLRLLDSAEVKMVNLLSLGEGRKPIVQGFPAGTAPPQAAGELSAADAIAPAATEAAVFAASPGDGTTVFYMEGMNAPMGSFGGYGHGVRAATVVDRSLRQVEPGVWSARLRIPVAGAYDVALLLERPRFAHCFHATAARNPALRKAAGELGLDFVSPPVGVPVPPGRVAYRFRLQDPTTGEPRTGLAGVEVVHYALPGRDKTTVRAREVGDGVYEALLDLPTPGVYNAMTQVPGIGVGAASLPFRSFLVREPPAPAAAPEGR